MTKKVSTNVVPVSDEARAKQLLQKFILEEQIADFSKVPEAAKLTLLQKTPQQFIKERQIPSGVYHYVDHIYSKKVLNFVFNFNISNEAIKEEYYNYVEEYYDYKDPKCTKDSRGNKIGIKKTRNVTEAEVTMRFTIERENGKTITRTVKSSHKGYANPATTRGDIMQSAFSKAWTKVGHTFGIGAELEDDLYAASKPREKEEEEIIDGEEIAPNETVKKNFNDWE